MENIKVLISGGAGFLGKAIIRELLDDNSLLKAEEIRVLDINDKMEINDDRVKVIRGDIRDYGTVSKAIQGIDVIVNTAAIVDWGTKSEKEIFSVNTGGTENIIRACEENNVKYLVHTSTLDVIYRGKPLVNIDETLDYPEKHVTSYCQSKYEAEKMVLSANNEKLKTIAIRPSDIYGEADPYHMEALINMARGGFYVRLGDGTAKCQHVYVGNIAHAHVLAIKELMNGNSKIAGNAYLITDAEGTNFFRFFDQIVEGAGYRIWPKNLWLPKSIAYPLATISEFMALLIRPFKKYYPRFSKFAVTYTCTDFTFSSEKARKDFGFVPKYTEEEALTRTIGYYKKDKR